MQVSVQLCTSAVNMTLPAYAAERHAVATNAERQHLLQGRHAATDQYLLPTRRSSKPAAAVDQWYRRTDTKPFYRHCSTYYADSVNNSRVRKQKQTEAATVSTTDDLYLPTDFVSKAKSPVSVHLFTLTFELLDL